MSRSVKVGDRAPRFSLRSQDGSTVSLDDFLGKKAVVLYFYPKDNTPGCTAEARAFSDRYEVFKDMGAEVIGVSSDSVDSHKGFAAKCGLRFNILSDPGGTIRKLYGAQSTLGLLPGRVTYIIDADGKVRHIFSSQMHPTQHVEEGVAVLASMKEETRQKAP